MFMTQHFVDHLQLVEIHWVLKTKTPYIIIKFSNNSDKNAVEKSRKNLDSKYQPHGSKIYIRTDYTPNQLAEAQETQKISTTLRSKGYFTYFQDSKIRIGKPPKSKWFRYDSLEIRDMIARSPTTEETGKNSV